MSEPRMFRGYELGEIPSADAAAAMAVARRIEAATMVASPAVLTHGFTDRVMTALADEPGPASVAFIAPLRKLGVLAGFGASIRQAWATLERPGRPTVARTAALAYVLTVAAAGVSLAGAATFGAAGALGLLGPTATQQATPTPAPVLAPVITPEPVAEPPEEPSIEPSPEPSEPADESEGPDDHGGGTGPEASDDHGGGTGPEATEERGDSSGPGGIDNSGPGESSPGATDDPGSSDGGGGSGSDGGSD
jgi:uncharacterized membrane protein YgcG